MTMQVGAGIKSVVSTSGQKTRLWFVVPGGAVVHSVKHWICGCKFKSQPGKAA